MSAGRDVSDDELSPVRIVKNDDIRGDQVDTQTAGAGSQQENELLTTRRVVVVDGVDSVLVRGISVDAAVLCRTILKLCY